MIFLSFTSKSRFPKIKAALKCKLYNIKISETKWEHLQRQKLFVYIQCIGFIHIRITSADRIDRLFEAVTLSIWSYQCDTNSKQIFQICVNYFLASYLFRNSLRLWLQIDAFLFLFFFSSSFPTVALGFFFCSFKHR